MNADTMKAVREALEACESDRQALLGDGQTTPDAMARMVQNALRLLDTEASQQDREAAIKDFRMDELDAVMHSVDKWFDNGDPRLNDNPATRAAHAREIALCAIEAAEAREAKLVEALETAMREPAWFKPGEDEGEPGVEEMLDDMRYDLKAGDKVELVMGLYFPVIVTITKAFDPETLDEAEYRVEGKLQAALADREGVGPSQKMRETLQDLAAGKDPSECRHLDSRGKP